MGQNTVIKTAGIIIDLRPFITALSCLISVGVLGQTNCLGDLNNNGSVEVTDILEVLADFSCFENCDLSDLDDDGLVGVSDILILLSLFGNECNNINPKVWTLPTFNYNVEDDLIYGQGLSHEDWGGEVIDTIELKLDAYVPINEETNRPALVLIHGGGFYGGSNETNAFVALAEEFSTRGWVVFSINYRVANHRGTVPGSWLYATQYLSEDLDINQVLAMYPANRDAKAAMRWIKHNADQYNIDPNYISVLGGSAGAYMSIALGVSNHQDYFNEISTIQDPSLLTTHIEETFEVKCILDFWGGKASVDALTLIDGQERFDSMDPPLMIVHGTLDPTVLYSQAQALLSEYQENEVECTLYPIEGEGHGIWNSNYMGTSFWELSFDFMAEHLLLDIQD